MDVQTRCGGRLPAYRALPDTRNGRAVVLGMSVWGWTDDLLDWADLLAGLGYAVLAPNLFWRTAARHGMAYDFGKFDAVLQAMAGATDEVGVQDLEDCAADLRQTASAASIGVVGWCHGGRLACLCAQSLVFQAAVAFYPTQLETRLDIVDRLQAPLSVHLPEIEEFGTSEDCIARIEDALRGRSGVEAFVYPGAKHGFGFSPPHPNHDHASAMLADARAAIFLSRALPAASGQTEPANTSERGSTA